jgi:hypothetical protein
MSKSRKQPMSDITPLTPGAQVSGVSDVQSADANQMPSIEELLGRVKRLESEKAEALEQAEGWKAQAEHLRNRGPIPVEMTTTTTKPTWPFIVSGPPGEEKYDVVDEGEAKRLYCIKHKIDPSVFALKVRCADLEKRNAAITQQYVDAKADTTRIPGVNMGV